MKPIGKNWKLTLPLMIFCVLNTRAQEINMDFAGTGAASAIDSVSVENLTQGISLTFKGDRILQLTPDEIGTGLSMDERSPELEVFPNPSTDHTLLRFIPPDPGDGVVSVLDASGKVVAQKASYFEGSPQELKLSGLQKGIYLVSVRGTSYRFTAKLLSNGRSAGAVHILSRRTDGIIHERIRQTAKKAGPVPVRFNYTSGDRLLFTGYSGNYSTVITDNPTGDKTMTFEFMECTDAVGNNYPVVAIGGQVWMARNMSCETGEGCWIYKDNQDLCELYGRLYDWETAQNVCPSGWHLPSAAEWTELIDYLIANGFNFDGSLSEDKTAQSLASTHIWYNGEEVPEWMHEGDPGWERLQNNRTGFSALPSGCRKGSGAYDYVQGITYFWTSTETEVEDVSICRRMQYDKISVDELIQPKTSGFCVRCLKDQ